MSYSLQEKIKKLNLSNDRVEYLKNIEVEELEFNRSDDIIYKGKYINVDDVVGTVRYIWNNPSWIDFLDKLHKMRNFDLYKEETFDYILNRQNEDCPCVVEKDGMYYIAGNGKHRLTIAKCLGNKKAFVAAVNYYDAIK